MSEEDIRRELSLINEAIEKLEARSCLTPGQASRMRRLEDRAFELENQLKK